MFRDFPLPPSRPHFLHSSHSSLVALIMSHTLHLARAITLLDWSPFWDCCGESTCLIEKGMVLVRHNYLLGIQFLERFHIWPKGPRSFYVSISRTSPFSIRIRAHARWMRLDVTQAPRAIGLCSSTKPSSLFNRSAMKSKWEKELYLSHNGASISRAADGKVSGFAVESCKDVAFKTASIWSRGPFNGNLALDPTSTRFE